MKTTMKKMTTIKLTLLAVIAGLFLTVSAQAATLTVNSLSDTQADDGACTLREAIINANADNQTGSTDCTAGAGADTINITIAGTISLLTPLPDMTTDMTINGLGAANTTVSRNSGAATEFRIFTKTAGTSTISNLTVRDGIARGATGATGGLNGGGGISNTGGQLTLTNVTVTNNRAFGGSGTGGAGGEAVGGGIYGSAPIIVSGSTISGNTATGGNGTTNGGNSFGGGIFVEFAALTVSDSTVSGNAAAGGTGTINGSGFGGGINANGGGSINMTNSTVSNNTATGDGGITNINGTSTLTNSFVSGNTAAGSNSGGIYNGGALTLTGSTVSGNTAATSAGGIANLGTLNVTNSTFSGNTATNGSGGGISNQPAGTLNLTNSTVSNNSATNGGGGGLINSGTANVTNSTFSGNTVNNFSGGGISNQPAGTLNLTNSTVSGNTATNGGGGLRNLGTATLTSSTFSNNSTTGGVGGGVSNSGTTTLDNTIIANSLAGGDCARLAGTVNATFSLIEQNLACVNGTNSNNLTGDPNLGALTNNGGSTQTHALLPGSIAIDKGNSTLTTDQRGSFRPVNDPNSPNGTGNLADIGAFEVQATTAASVSISGRVMVSGGRGLANALVYLTDQNGNTRVARSSTFGYYRFETVAAGQTVIITVTSKRYQFNPQVVTVNEQIDDLNLTAQNN